MKKIYLLTITIILFACEGKQGELGPEGLNSLINILAEPVGVNCSSGGYQIETGVDLNDNGILNVDEILSTRYVCNGEFDKEIRISFGLIPNPSSSVEGIAFADNVDGTILDNTRSISNFNIENYIGIDSITFSAFLKTTNTSVKCIAELYNSTDNAVIIGSEIFTNTSSSFTFAVSSTNFFENFPKKSINLSVRLRTEQNNTIVYMTNPVLVLYRK